MTGIPVVTFGAQVSNVLSNPEVANTYEIPTLVKNWEEAIFSDDLGEVKDGIDQLLKCNKLAIAIGSAGRRKALKLFSKSAITDQWRKFLNRL